MSSDDPLSGAGTSEAEYMDSLNETLRFVAELRGGISAACDFCGSPLSKDNEPVPEEGDLWAGYNCCWLCWEAEEKAERERREGAKDGL